MTYFQQLLYHLDRMATEKYLIQKENIYTHTAIIQIFVPKYFNLSKTNYKPAKERKKYIFFSFSYNHRSDAIIRIYSHSRTQLLSYVFEYSKQKTQIYSLARVCKSIHC